MPLEKDKLEQALTTTFDNFIAAFERFDAARINVKPGADSWTPAQVTTHIILSTDGVPDGTTRPLDREIDSLLPAIRPWWEDLNQKFQAPEVLQPDDQPRVKAEVLTELQRVKAKDLAILRQQDLTLICLDMELPSIGYLTRYEWLWFIEMHLRRHTFQLQNMQ
jgi:DinB superfamily